MADSIAKRPKVEGIAVVLLIGVFVFFAVRQLRPRPIPAERQVGRRTQCKNYLKQIGIALANYHDDYKSFPPAFVADPGGRPMHSWRVLLLPYLDQKELYRQYRFDEPWDGPNNSKLADQVSECYRCPTFVLKQQPFESDAPHVKYLTNYVALTGAGAAFDGSRSITLQDIKDSAKDTILIAEVRQYSVNWMQPDDVSVNQLITEISQSNSDAHTVHVGGLHVLMADGSVRFITQNCDRATIRALCTIAGGETIPND